MASWRRAFLVAVVAGVAAAGCLEPPAEQATVQFADSSPSDSSTSTSIDASRVPASRSPVETGTPSPSPPPSSPGPSPAPAPTYALSAAAHRLELEGSCSEPCAPVPFTLEATGVKRLRVVVHWNGTTSPGYEALLETPEGNRSARLGYWMALVNLRDPPGGAYALLLFGSGPFTLVLEAIAHGPAPDGLRPDLVTLIPSEVYVGSCTLHESTEQSARRCLRISNAVGNVGEGPLEVRLDAANAALTPGGLGHFVQRVYDLAGGYVDEPVATSQLHPTHGHFHYTGLAGFQLYAFDATTGLQGPPVSAMKKSGFCFIDIGTIRDPDVEPAPGRYDGLNCFVPEATDWYMGVSVGWYDEYTAGLDEQYVEISDVPDGVYELVSTADAEGTLRETREDNNAASVILELRGDVVSILDGRGLYST